jgi:hypothetical protein
MGSKKRVYRAHYLDFTTWNFWIVNIGREVEKLHKYIDVFVNLRHFHQTNEFHSDITMDWKMKCLQEVKEVQYYNMCKLYIYW